MPLIQNLRSLLTPTETQAAPEHAFRRHAQTTHRWSGLRRSTGEWDVANTLIVQVVDAGRIAATPPLKPWLSLASISSSGPTG
jgi:hypothetical protein